MDRFEEFSKVFFNKKNRLNIWGAILDVASPVNTPFYALQIAEYGSIRRSDCSAELQILADYNKVENAPSGVEPPVDEWPGRVRWYVLGDLQWWENVHGIIVGQRAQFSGQPALQRIHREP